MMEEGGGKGECLSFKDYYINDFTVLVLTSTCALHRVAKVQISSSDC